MKKLLALLLLFAPLVAQDIPVRGSLIPDGDFTRKLGTYNRRFDSAFVRYLVAANGLFQVVKVSSTIGWVGFGDGSLLDIDGSGQFGQQVRVGDPGVGNGLVRWYQSASTETYDMRPPTTAWPASRTLIIPILSGTDTIATLNVHNFFKQDMDVEGRFYGDTASNRAGAFVILDSADVYGYMRILGALLVRDSMRVGTPAVPGRVVIGDGNTPTENTATLTFNNTDKTVDLVPSGTAVTLQVGQEEYLRSTNKTGSDIPEGSVVYVNGAQGQRPTIALTRGNAEATASVIGVTTEDIDDNATGFVTTWGHVRGLNTNAWTEGTKLYASKWTPGALTDTVPNAPHHQNFVATVVYQNASNGILFVHPDRHLDLEQIANVDTTQPSTNGGPLAWNATTQRWEQRPYVNIDSMLVQQIRLKGVKETDIQPGTIYWDSTQRAFGGWQYIVNRYFDMTHNVVMANVVDTNSTAETTLYTANMGANYPSVGKVVTIMLHGDYSIAAGASKTLTFRIKKGATTLLTNVITSSGTALRPWHSETVLTFRNIGTSGQMEIFSEFDTESGSIDAYASNVAINTTTTNDLTVTVQISDAGANYVRLLQGYTTTRQ
jgi:hypothetical protein